MSQLHELAVKAREDLRADRCSIYKLHKEKGELLCLAASGPEEQAPIRLSANRGLVGAVARSGHTLNLKDAYNDPRFDRSIDRSTGYRTRSLLAMPIRDERGHIIGVFQVINAVTGSFSTNEEATLRQYCEQAAKFLSSP